jgi:hypothetical protein
MVGVAQSMLSIESMLAGLSKLAGLSTLYCGAGAGRGAGGGAGAAAGGGAGAGAGGGGGAGESSDATDAGESNDVSGNRNPSRAVSTDAGGGTFVRSVVSRSLMSSASPELLSAPARAMKPPTLKAVAAALAPAIFHCLLRAMMSSCGGSGCGL